MKEIEPHNSPPPISNINRTDLGITSQSVLKLDKTLQQKFPSYTPEQIQMVRDGVIDWVNSGIENGFDPALFKQEERKKKMRVLQLTEVFPTTRTNRLQGGE